MFDVVFSSRGPIRRGEVLALVVGGDEPVVVTIKCFLGNPPEYQPCPECGEFRSSPEVNEYAFQVPRKLRNGDDIQIEVWGSMSRVTQNFRFSVWGEY